MPNDKLTYRRGEIRWMRLDPTLGAEIQKTRSWLIVQDDVMNQYGLLTVVMPFRPGSRKAPYVVNVQASAQNGLDQDRFIDVGQIRSIDHSRVLERIGVLEAQYWPAVRSALDLVLGFEP
ncbi:type II toxin-antitoxin system PemK/MazF family toxin [Gloeobacter violaceus]|uniref:mRNA interferase n=1 Tax=Gloeobacter violaceus (strain ATCC 29082 / PCC 7421) TaxID=251221 RepID=Q7NI95_GLOVI|nr:type II toxin-antitoxin system PemK/MazF family toxin [Gloeobacter violaceus]BAC90229.1 glr2288 [Gloeobacter violaceus PCC 7421]